MDHGLHREEPAAGSVSIERERARRGLMSYGASQPDLFRRAAGYVHRILQGTKPADMRWSWREVRSRGQPENRKVLGLELTPTFIARADEVIE